MSHDSFTANDVCDRIYAGQYVSMQLARIRDGLIEYVTAGYLGLTQDNGDYVFFPIINDDPTEDQMRVRATLDKFKPDSPYPEEDDDYRDNKRLMRSALSQDSSRDIRV